jgi:hypothetical protein
MANDIGSDFADKEMLLVEPDWIEEIGSTFQIERRFLKYNISLGDISQLNTDAPINLEVNYPLYNYQSIYTLIDFFNSRKAKNESFWFLHPARLFTLQANYSSGGSYLRCDRNYSHLWTQGLSSQYDWGIYIKMKNGDLITRKVTGIVDSESPSYSLVYLDETIPRDIYVESSSLSNHYIIGRMLVGRFDQDELSIQLESKNQGRASVKLQENYREYESWTPIEGVRYWKIFQFDTCHTVHSQNLSSPWGTYGIYSYYFDILGRDGDSWFRPYLRFLNVGIPPGASILLCKLKFKHLNNDWSRYTNMVVNISFADQDSASDISDFLDWAARPRTTVTTWNITGDWVPGEIYETVDMSQSLQDVIDRGGWQSGNSLILFLDTVSISGSYSMRYINFRDDPAYISRARMKVGWA